MICEWGCRSKKHERNCTLFSFITGTGAVAFMYKGDDEVTIELVGWKGNKSVRAYVAKNDRLHYLRLLGADTSKYEKNKFAEQRDQEAKTSLEKNILVEVDSNEEKPLSGVDHNSGDISENSNNEMTIETNGS